MKHWTCNPAYPPKCFVPVGILHHFVVHFPYYPSLSFIQVHRLKSLTVVDQLFYTRDIVLSRYLAEDAFNAIAQADAREIICIAVFNDLRITADFFL